MDIQTIRILDVFVLGPFLLYMAYKAKSINQLERAGLTAAGVLTISYNYEGYMNEREKRMMEEELGLT